MSQVGPVRAGVRPGPLTNLAIDACSIIKFSKKSTKRVKGYMASNGFPTTEVLTSDIPKIRPEDDRYGYVPFANLVAEAILTTPSPQGLVMGIHGIWGSGKSTLLNFVKHYLALPENSTEILVVDFNPWWFADRNQLASQFLTRFHTALKQDPSFVRKIGDLMSDYADSLALASTTSAGIPWASGAVAWLLKKFKIKQKDIPELKEKISKVLSTSSRRVLFIIDDIDRLTPDEIKELFKVIKALADFPNVLYLLSFDREVVHQALSSSLKVDGGAYLEKIIQAPFALPAVDKLHLRRDLFKRLDFLLNKCPAKQFDSDYWQNIYISGIDVFINKPRDIVRLVNALFVTYPPLASEVNAVDFFALEALRVFEPSVYETIRDNAQMFVGYRDQNRDENDSLRKFHDRWLAAVPERRRESVRDLISEMFPKVESTWGGSGYGSDWLGIWRRSLRACCPELFQTYFQFGLPDGRLSRAELDAVLRIAEQNGDLDTILREASVIKRSDGSSKVYELMERIKDLDDELSPNAAARLLKAVFHNGKVLLASGEENNGMFSIPAIWRLRWFIDHLLSRVTSTDRYDLLGRLVQDAQDLTVPLYVVDSIRENSSTGKPTRDKALNSFSGIETAALVSLMLRRLEKMDSNDFVSLDNLATIAYIWLRLGGTSQVREKIGSLFLRAESLPKMLDEFKSVSRSQTLGKAAITRDISLDPKNLDEIVDLEILRPIIESALVEGALKAEQRAAAISFLSKLSGEKLHESDA